MLFGQNKIVASSVTICLMGIQTPMSAKIVQTKLTARIEEKVLDFNWKLSDHRPELIPSDYSFHCS